MNEWRIILEHEDYEHVVTHFPENFEGLQYGINRDTNFYGIFSEFGGTLRFIKDGKQFIDNVYKESGYDAKIYISFQNLNKKGMYFETKKKALCDSQTYSAYQDFSEIGFSDIDFVTKLRNRWELEIKYNASETLEGVLLPGIENAIENITLRGEGVDSVSKGVAFHKLMTSILQQITDSDYECFFCNLTGRQGGDYGVDGLLSYVYFTNGYWLRGFDTENFKCSLKTIFEGFNKIMPLAIKIIYNKDNKPVVYMGKRNEVFLNSIVYTFEKDTIIEGMRKEPSDNYLYDVIKIGYENVKEVPLGMSSVLVKAEYSKNILNGENLELLSGLVGDGAVIEHVRSDLKKSVNVEASEFDNKIFFIDCVLLDKLYNRQSEDFQSMSGIYENKNIVYNIRFTPAHNLIAHSELISVGLRNKERGLKITSFDKFSENFQSQFADDIDAVKENRDLEYWQLKKPYLSGNIYRFTCNVKFEDLVAIDNPEGLFKFFSTIDNEWKFGYIEKDISTSPIDLDTNVNLYEAVEVEQQGEFGFLKLMDDRYLRLLSGGRIKLLN